MPRPFLQTPRKTFHLSDDYRFELLNKEADNLGMILFRYPVYFKRDAIDGGQACMHVKTTISLRLMRHLKGSAIKTNSSKKTAQSY
ncbi:MAG: hypothetical protein GC180_11490 [Bacteroidetes bacterium]|nr:hypothetical protein [Bacteroidota bacterium]